VDTRRHVEASERLSNPPIIEAILIIEHEVPHGVDPRALDAFHDAIRDRYPHPDVRLIPEYFSTSDADPGPESGEYSTYLFSSSEEPHVVQISARGFMFHRLRQYSTFEPFVGEARRIWDIYSAFLTSGPVGRLSLRYINDIQLDVGSLDELSLYLRIRPEVAAPLARDWRNMLLRIGMKDDRIPAYGIITQTFEPLDGSAGVSLILDMEATSKGPFSSERNSIWDVFQELRQLKNRLFLESITDRTRNLFQ
jgi:uncharacterized protein (TIGR04255 family)